MRGARIYHRRRKGRLLNLHLWLSLCGSRRSRGGDRWCGGRSRIEGWGDRWSRRRLRWGNLGLSLGGWFLCCCLLSRKLGLAGCRSRDCDFALGTWPGSTRDSCGDFQSSVTRWTSEGNFLIRAGLHVRSDLGRRQIRAFVRYASVTRSSDATRAIRRSSDELLNSKHSLPFPNHAGKIRLTSLQF